MGLLFVPGLQKASIEIKEIDLRDGFIETFHDIFGRGPVSNEPREKRLEIERIEFFERPHGLFDFALATTDKSAQHAHGFLVEPPERPGAIAQKLRMLAKQEQLGGSIEFGAPQQVANREGKVLVSGERTGNVEDAKSIAHEPDSQVGIFRDSKARVEGAGGEDGVAPDAHIAGDEIGAMRVHSFFQGDLREKKWMPRQEIREGALGSGRGIAEVAQHGQFFAAVLFLLMQMFREQIRTGDCIVIDQQQKFSPGMLDTQPPRRSGSGIRLAEIMEGIAGVKAAAKCFGAVRGAVIRHDYFEFTARERLIVQRGQACSKRHLPVIRGNYNGQPWASFATAGHVRARRRGSRRVG